MVPPKWSKTQKIRNKSKCLVVTCVFETNESELFSPTRTISSDLTRHLQN